MMSGVQVKLQWKPHTALTVGMPLTSIMVLGVQVQLQWKPETALTVVMAAKGYPGSYKKGTPIRSLDKVTGAKVSRGGCSST
jgi:phosphoribosylamine-glycine ligase